MMSTVEHGKQIFQSCSAILASNYGFISTYVIRAPLTTDTIANDNSGKY
jgi:hypothetical protein